MEEGRITLQLIKFAHQQESKRRMMGLTDSKHEEQPRTASFPTATLLQLPRNPWEAHLVGQFLQAVQIKGQSDAHSDSSCEKASVSQQNPASGSCQSPSNLQNSKGSCSGKSLFHNFQKHLVTTLKMGISINKLNTKNDPTVHLAQRMWRLFQKSNYYSKRVLHFLFGVEGTVPPAFEGFAEVASVYPHYEIQLAQQYLREEVVRQGKRLLGRSLLSHRRMQRAHQFQSYFEKFLEEIEGGAISRRLPKAAKLQVLQGVGRE